MKGSAGTGAMGRSLEEMPEQCGQREMKVDSCV